MNLAWALLSVTLWLYSAPTPTLTLQLARGRLVTSWSWP
jgi:hypothetical protein